MKHYIACFALLALLGCQSAVAPDPPRITKAVQLIPDPARSFAYPSATQFDVAILGEDWAVRFNVPGNRNQFPAGSLNIESGYFHRGPELQKYIKPPAGPATPHLPKNDEYSVSSITNVAITVVGGVNAPEPRGHVILTVSNFVSEGKTYQLEGPIRLRFRGPYP